ELAAALSVDPDSVAICGEGGFDPWEAVSVRQPPLPPPGGDFAIALGLALGKAY
ncbi:DNA utilization protein HofM, partial [Shigella flexneri]